MIIHGFYIIKDSFFELVKDPFLKNNKNENRPFYYCLKEEGLPNDFYWMIPLSSKVEKYRTIILKKVEQHKPTDGLFICKLPNDKESAFLIQDMFPITEKYIEREFTLFNNPLVLVNENDINTIERKAKHIVKLLKRGIKITPTSPDIQKIMSLLMK